MTINLTKWLGLHMRRMKGSDDKVYVTGTAWYPRSRTRLGYLYFSFRFLGLVGLALVAPSLLDHDAAQAIWASGSLFILPVGRG